MKNITVKDIVILKRQAIKSKNANYINKVDNYIKSIIPKQNEIQRVALEQALLTTTY
jgi:hypothetical protein